MPSIIRPFLRCLCKRSSHCAVPSPWTGIGFSRRTHSNLLCRFSHYCTVVHYSTLHLRLSAPTCPSRSSPTRILPYTTCTRASTEIEAEFLHKVCSVGINMHAPRMAQISFISFSQSTWFRVDDDDIFADNLRSCRIALRKGMILRYARHHISIELMDGTFPYITLISGLSPL